MLYYSESWAEDAPDEEIEKELRAYTNRIKARRHAAIDKALAAYKMQAHTGAMQEQKLSCKIAGS
jgi:hypothetical protein